MAFDQSARNRLQKFVSEARSILTEEFTRQLQATYGMDPKHGTVAELDSLNFLDNQGRQIATILRETLAHYVTSLSGKSAKEQTKQALDRIIREQAFTVLNRLGALRMAEARGFLLESIAKGYSSKGFQLYKNLAGTALGETGDAYRQYLFSLFDEFSLDLAVLFDRHSSQGRLFPRESALLALLEQINHFEIEHLWAEDETIGWIYQYFNSQEERKKMRAESQAPRNSRELAVRNQFFTPRYVVEFLTDNTLGRLWVDALGDKTSLSNHCRYLLVKVNKEIISSRKPRDPRTLKLLDPACGSMHFGLYAFDLFIVIYREAWEWEQEHGLGSLDRAEYKDVLKPLSETYSNIDSFLLDVPKLIIEHNIYGVDIDSRAAQIASLALWLRAQRAWHDAGVKAQNRPIIGQGNIVPAVAPPKEVDLRDQFVNGLNYLDAKLFDQALDLLGGIPEQGAMLKVETELPRLIKKIYGGHGDLFKVEDAKMWSSAENRLRKALSDFSISALSSYQGHLYAEDALQDLRLIDLCNEKFDVVLMNPPFGALAANSKAELANAYPCSKNDLLAIFVERGLDLLRTGGRIGAITSRTCFFLSSFQKWREEVVLGTGKPEIMADLGYGVMDDAMVEAAAYVLIKNPKKSASHTIILRLLNDINKGENLFIVCSDYRKEIHNDRIFKLASSSFLVVPGAPFSYWVSDKVRNVFSKFPAFNSEHRSVKQGLATADDFRFLRTWWEIIDDGWVGFAKGGTYSPIYADVHLKINWENASSQIWAITNDTGKPKSNIWMLSETIKSSFFRPGLTWPLRTQKFGVRVLPNNNIFSHKGPSAFESTNNKTKLLTLLSIMNSKPFGTIVELSLNAGDRTARSYEVGIIKNIPIPELSFSEEEQLASLARKSWSLKRSLDSTEETSHAFLLPEALLFHQSDFTPGKIEKELAEIQREIDDVAFDLYGFSEEDRLAAMQGQNTSNSCEESTEDDEDIDTPLDKDQIASLLSWVMGVVFGRFDIRLATGERSIPEEPEPFDSLPDISPGMLPQDKTPLIKHSGILPEDDSHPNDVKRLIEKVLIEIGVEMSTDVSRWLHRDCFDRHLKSYSKSRRFAPIYWPLSTKSDLYTLWVYYPSISEQTLYTCVNDFVDPKLKMVSDDLNSLRNKFARSSTEEKELAKLSDLEVELKDFRDELLRLAKFWKPNLNDGVQITAAPLWKLFQHKQWQKKLQETWEKLEKGDYDWAHLALSIWPDRVLRKCHKDYSLAIAHNVESDFWEEIEVPVIRREKDTGETKWEYQPKKLSENDLSDLIRQKMTEARK